MLVPFVRCALAVAAVVFTLAAPPAHAQAINNAMQVQAVTITLSGGTARGYFAAINLTDPTVEIVVTDPGVGAEANLLRTDTWRANVGARLAINANFFGVTSGSNADIVGLSITNGQVVSPIRTWNGRPDPAVAFTRERLARIGYLGSPDLTNAWDAVAGVGGSSTEPGVPGDLLVTNGVNTGASARVDPLNRNPRTAIGIDRTGTTLFLCVIDGRQSNWSVGMTLPELAAFMIERGAWNAVNLDGGGSGSFVWLNNSNAVESNRPSDGQHRAVANHLGIRINTPTPDRVHRPIRGAWLRPTSIPTFEGTVSILAQNGIQDIFLETLWWGRDIGTTGVFPQHFSFDFLDQAIKIANKYSVRVHAWCETGYLDFGTTTSALLQQNPGWIVDHRDPANTTTGDKPDQRFVNLGNPAVRAKLNEYFAALTEKYPGLAGIQADYHFFPLAPSGAAPWSFDAWARSAYQAQYGVDPVSETNTGATTYPTRWLDWNRQNITTALVQIRDAVDTVSPAPLFSAVAFADWDSNFHRSKMIDLQRWTRQNGADMYFVMSYFTGTSALNSISLDLLEGQTWTPGRRLVAGLANLTTATRPAINDQLDTAKARGIEDFAWFDAPTFINNPPQRTLLRDWIANNATKQRGDINADGYICARDVALFDTLFTGAPIPRTTQNARYDLDNSQVINAADRTMLILDFNRFRFGEDNVIDARDLTALRNAYISGGAPSAAMPLNLFDLNGDGSVNYADELILNARFTVPQPPDTDADRNGRTDTEDLHFLNRSLTVDVNRDGVINTADIHALDNAVQTLQR